MVKIYRNKENRRGDDSKVIVIKGWNVEGV